MKRVEAIVAVALASAMALSQSGCVLGAKPNPAATSAPPAPKPAADSKPAAAEEALSVPQTQVVLPPPQPINPDALALPPKAEEPSPAPPAPRPTRRTTPTQPRPDATATTGPPATAASSTPSTPQPELAPVEVVLSAEEKKSLQDSADRSKAEIRHLLVQIKSHRLSKEEDRDMKRIQSLVEQSNVVERGGDVRQAEALAQRALVLAREMTGVK